MTDDLRPRGTVEVTCACGTSFWIDPLDPRLPDGPFKCWGCEPPVDLVDKLLDMENPPVSIAIATCVACKRERSFPIDPPITTRRQQIAFLDKLKEADPCMWCGAEIITVDFRGPR